MSSRRDRALSGVERDKSHRRGLIEQSETVVGGLA
jgi:hypothetical protein